MREFDSPTFRSKMTKYRAPLIALAVVLIGGAGFAATGGVQAAKAILVKIKLQGADGTIFEGSLQPDESGVAEVRVEGDDGQTTKLLMQVQEGGMINVPPTQDGEPHQIMVQVGTDADSLDPEKLKLLVGDAASNVITMQHLTINQDGEESHWSLEPTDGSIELQVEVTGGEGAAAGDADGPTRMEVSVTDHMGQSVTGATGVAWKFVDAIGEPIEAFEWEGDDGLMRTISIVATSVDDKLNQYSIYSTMTDGRYVEVGKMIMAGAGAVAPIDLTVNDDGTATLIMSRPDGGKIEVAVQPILTVAELDAKTPRGIMMRKTDRDEQE